ncbi:MAG: hypothetical protein GY822_28100 [Deltaproteobacteria bacterium]|nr:hypothetical protein [Deltaproteobacteria bacterium]
MNEAKKSGVSFAAKRRGSDLEMTFSAEVRQGGDDRGVFVPSAAFAARFGETYSKSRAKIAGCLAGVGDRGFSSGRTSSAIAERGERHCAG